MKEKSKVYEIYNQIIDWFDTHRNKELIEKNYLELILSLIPQNSSILDVGCGTGEPIAKFFIEKGYNVTGIDASKKMINLCKKRFPNQTWIVADMRTLNLQKQFDAVVAWHSLFHINFEEQRSTLNILASHLKSSGILAFTSGQEHGESFSNNGGHELYHASLSTEEYQKELNKNGLKVINHTLKDVDCGGATVWVTQNIT